MTRIVNESGRLNWAKSSLAILALYAMTTLAAPAQTFETMHTFDAADGQGPTGLVQGTDGNFYGTTEYGGANCPNFGCGTVFKITLSGTLTTLYSFCPDLQSNCTDGQVPTAALVQGTDGNFYGSTLFGASGSTVFKITPSGALTTLSTVGFAPNALIQATDGNFYGTTQATGSNANNGGTIFVMTPSGAVTTLYTFCSKSGCADGANPAAALVQGTDGNFYGTTRAGGNCIPPGCGTVFKVTPNGTLTTLYSFCPQTGCADGAYPAAALVQASDGNFYGTTGGTIFKITPSGALTTLYTFCLQSGCPDGSGPDAAALVQAPDGNFYGSARGGGANGGGTIFKVTPSGALTTL
jgi:uncharacterized repeat protein (TIGR03803 family)